MYAEGLAKTPYQQASGNWKARVKVGKSRCDSLSSRIHWTSDAFRNGFFPRRVSGYVRHRTKETFFGLTLSLYKNNVLAEIH